MLSTWDNNEYRKNEYLDIVWKDCYKLNKEHFYHIGAKETNRKPMIEALITNYKTINKQDIDNQSEKRTIQLDIFADFNDEWF